MESQIYGIQYSSHIEANRAALGICTLNTPDSSLFSKHLKACSLIYEFAYVFPPWYICCQYQIAPSRPISNTDASVHWCFTGSCVPGNTGWPEEASSVLFEEDSEYGMTKTSENANRNIWQCPKDNWSPFFFFFFVQFLVFLRSLTAVSCSHCHAARKYFTINLNYFPSW